MSELGTFLFARPSFAEGVGRLVDFGGMLNEYNYSPSGSQADILAQWADWTAVGNDIRTALIDATIEAKQRVRDVETLTTAAATR